MRSQETQQLISKLVADLKPVPVISRTIVRGAWWLFFSGVTVSLSLYFLGGPRPDITYVWKYSQFLLDVAFLLLATITATLVAFRLSVPDTKVRYSNKILLFISTGSWIFLCLKCFLASDISSHIEDTFTLKPMHCLADLALMSLPALSIFFLMLTKSASTHIWWTGYAAALASTSIAALGARSLCSLDFETHLLIWHFLPIGLYALVGAALTRICLK